MEMPVTLASSIKQQKTMKAANELPKFPHELAQQPMNHGWLVFYGNYPHSHDLSLTVGMKMPIVYELTMYCKCQADRSTPVKCLCKSHCQGVRKNHTGALMKFFLDCNDYSRRQASFEGLKESTVFLNVRAFVGLKDGRSSHWVGWCCVRAGGVKA